eukprot:6854504-Pyramimonas_sp.AAC.3
MCLQSPNAQLHRSEVSRWGVQEGFRRGSGGVKKGFRRSSEGVQKFRMGSGWDIQGVSITRSTPRLLHISFL